MGAALATGLLTAGGAHAQTAPQITPRPIADPRAALFTPDDLLWLEVRVGDQQVAETMDAYASRSGVFLPLGQFSRVLDLAIGVFPAQGRAEGWVLQRERRLVVDLPGGFAEIDGRRIPIGPGQAQVSGDEIFLRVDLVEQILPLRLSADTSAQTLTVNPTETLPFQARLEREARARSLTFGARGAEAVRIPLPYTAFSPPVFDLNAGGQLSRDGADNGQRFDLRVAGDLAWGSLQTFVGSNDDGEISDIRMSWSRKDPDGHALGPFGGTRAGLGDVFSPSLPIGIAGLAGRGVYYSSAPLESLDIATPLNLRGELALGEEVELYVNEVLQASRASAVQGRYEFLDVPLTHGLNVVRLVFYGAQGQTREVVRRINFGAGQVQAGQLVFRFGAVEQGRSLFTTGREADVFEAGALRLALQADYGVNERLTVSAGLGVHTPTDAEQRIMGFVGARGSLGPAALQFDVAADDLGGSALSGNLSTRLGGLSLLARHSEYRDGFIDETRQLGVTSAQALQRATDFRADWQVRLRRGVVIPFSLDARRLERINGEASSQVSGRVAAPLAGFYGSSNLTWERIEGAGGGDLIYGETDLATLVRRGIQFRGGVSYTLHPDARFDTSYATLDFDFTERNALRLAAIRALETGDTSLQASSLWRFDSFDLAVNSSYETRSQEWRLGLQLSVSFGYDPRAGGYRARRPGSATGGAAYIDAFIDDNGDGRRQPYEEGVAGIVLDTPGGAVTTGEDGEAFVSGLGDGAMVRLRVDATGIEDPFLVGGPTELEGTPRPGHTLMVAYPLQRTSELQAVARLRRADGSLSPLAALDVELVSADGQTVYPARTDHAGVVYYEGVRAGVYVLRLSEQARALGLSAEEDLTVTVDGGGFSDAGDLVVVVSGSPNQ